MMIVVIMMMITMMMIIIMVLDSIVGQFGFFVGAVASGEKVLSAGEIAPSVIIPIILFIIIVIIIITIIIFVIIITFFVCYLEPLRPPMNPPRTSKTPKNRLKILTIPTLAPAILSQTPQFMPFFVTVVVLTVCTLLHRLLPPLPFSFSIFCSFVLSVLSY